MEQIHKPLTQKRVGFYMRISKNERDEYIIIIIIGSAATGGTGLFKKLCPFVSVEGDFPSILDPYYSHVLINTILPSQLRSSNTSCNIWFGVEYFFNSPIVVHWHQVPCQC